MEKMNEKVLRQRKMLLFLPVLLIPMVTLTFYGLGGGRASSTVRSVSGRGLNMSLPEVRFDPKKKVLNKLGLYAMADQDSLRLRESREHDPYWSGRSAPFRDTGFVRRGGVAGLSAHKAATDSQAERLMRQLDQLRSVVAAEGSRGSRGAGTSGGSSGAGLAAGFAGGPVSSVPLSGFSGSGAAGAGTMPSSTPAFGPRASARPIGGDPDLDKLNALMDKVLRIRYPGEARLADTSVPSVAAASLAPAAVEPVLTPLAGVASDDAGFIELDEGAGMDSVSAAGLFAVVDGAQTLVSGESVVFRLAEDGMLGGVRVPRGTAFAGRASLSGERLMVSVSLVRVGSRVIPVALEVVDMDGMAGIRVKGSINRDVAKESASEAAESLGVVSADGSLQGEAVGAGVQTMRSLLSRKVRLVRVGLPAGYRVLLKNVKRGL